MGVSSCGTLGSEMGAKSVEMYLEVAGLVVAVRAALGSDSVR